MAASTDYDAVILDVMLPGIDGFETPCLGSSFRPGTGRCLVGVCPPPGGRRPSAHITGSPPGRRPQRGRRPGRGSQTFGSRPLYLAATAQLPTALRFDSANSDSTGAPALNSLVRKTMTIPSSPSPASPVSSIFSPAAPSKKGLEVTFLSTLPTPVPASLLPALFPPRYAQKLPVGLITGSDTCPTQGAVAVSASASSR